MPNATNGNGHILRILSKPYDSLTYANISEKLKNQFLEIISDSAQPEKSYQKMDSTDSDILLLIDVTEEPKTAMGFPIRFLWLPYLLLTILLLILISVSFCKYHEKHGHKYRQGGLFSGIPVIKKCFDFLERHQEEHMAPEPGTSHIPRPSQPPPPPRTTSKDYYEIQGQQVITVNQSTSTRTSVIIEPKSCNMCNCQHGKSTTPHEHPVVPNNVPNTCTETKSVRRNPSIKRHPSSKRSSRASSDKVTFTNNTNGSMIDIRVTGNESVNMFKTSFLPTKTTTTTSVWSTASKPNKKDYTKLPSSSGLPYYENEVEDVYLISQSQL